MPADRETHWVYGPVPSRRLGRSLGVDLVPFKTCTYDCIYCQLGRTTCKTTERRPWAPVDDLLQQVRAVLPSRPDYITLSGSGEPTLNVHLGEIIDRIKSMTDVPTAVLTNGSLLWRQDVREELAAADVVLPSLDAGDEATFQDVNRPHEDIPFARMLEGLVAFRGQFRGRLWLEVFLLDGHSAGDSQVAQIARCAKEIRPDRIHLNTIARPPAEPSATAVGHDRLIALAEMFTPHAEIIVAAAIPEQAKPSAATAEAVLALLRRRPCTIADIAAGLAIHRNEAVKHVEWLTQRGLIEHRRIGDKDFLSAAGREQPGS